MRIILPIILIFISTQSFANPLKGKGLICKIKNNYKYVFNYEAFYFKKDKAIYSSLEIDNDDKWGFRENSTDKYSVTSDSIYPLDGSRRVSRKSLIYYGTYVGGDTAEIGSCEAYSSKREFNKAKKKITRERQIEYNKGMKGNKI